MCNSILPKAGVERKKYLRQGQWALLSDHQVPSHIQPCPTFPASVSGDAFWFLGRLLACPLTHMGFLWVWKFSLNSEELWWQERRLSLLSVVLRRSWEGWKGDQSLFYLSGSSDPIIPSLHFRVLVVVAPGFIACVCLSLAIISICPFLPSVFFSQLVSITLCYFPPFLICHLVWQSVLPHCLPSQHMARLSHQSLQPLPEEPGRRSG